MDRVVTITIDNMSITTGLELLVLYFEANDSFTFPDDYKKLEWGQLKEKSSEEEQEAAIMCGLAHLEKTDEIKSYESKNGSKTWILMNSQKNSPQVVQLSKNTCDNVATVSNAFLPLLDLNITETSNPNNIGEADIIILLSVVQKLAKDLEEKSSALNRKKK